MVTTAAARAAAAAAVSPASGAKPVGMVGAAAATAEVVPRAIVTYSRKRRREDGATLRRSPTSGRIRPKFSSKPRNASSGRSSTGGGGGTIARAVDHSPDPLSPPAEPQERQGAVGPPGLAAPARAPAGDSASKPKITFQAFFGAAKKKLSSPSPEAPQIVEAIAVKPGELIAQRAKKPKASSKNNPKVWPLFKPGAAAAPTPAPAKPRPSKPARTPVGNSSNSKQLLLDVGQKGLAPTTCAVCGMMYSRSSEEDKVAHSAYHRKFELGVRFTGWKQERIIRLFGESEHGARVIQLRAGDRAAHLQKFGQLKEVMDAEMGFVAPSGGNSSGATDSPSNQGASPLREAAGELAYISISATGTAVACAIVQRISVGFPVASHADAAAAGDTSPGMHAPEASDSLVCSTSPQPCSVGVKQMWVHRSHRRKGHMTRLLDVIRANYTPGRMVDKAELAFTQTTPDGKQFAVHYCGTKHYKIYEASW